jgi:hypothetical protein
MRPDQVYALALLRMAEVEEHNRRALKAPGRKRADPWEIVRTRRRRADERPELPTLIARDLRGERQHR